MAIRIYERDDLIGLGMNELINIVKALDEDVEVPECVNHDEWFDEIKDMIMTLQAGATGYHTGHLDGEVKLLASQQGVMLRMETCTSGGLKEFLKTIESSELLRKDNCTMMIGTKLLQLDKQFPFEMVLPRHESLHALEGRVWSAINESLDWSWGSWSGERDEYGNYVLRITLRRKYPGWLRRDNNESQ